MAIGDAARRIISIMTSKILLKECGESIPEYLNEPIADKAKDTNKKATVTDEKKSTSECTKKNEAVTLPAIDSKPVKK